MTQSDYASFLAQKRPAVQSVGFDVDPDRLHPAMKPHQRAVCRLAIARGRQAVWLDTGLGKSLVELEWAQQLLRTGHASRVLLFAPLGVAQQLVRDEAPKWGYEVTYARHADEAPATGITVTNYERLDGFPPADWPAVALDEADILANFSGSTKRTLVKSYRDTPFKLTLTATPAPNDTVELCNQADFLSVMPQQEMLSRFFTPKGVKGSATGQYRLKGHARRDFFRWLATWAVACKTPSDLGYPDDGYLLPPLEILPAFVPVDWTPPGQLFLTELKGVTERAQVRRATLDARMEQAATLVAAEPGEPWLLWYGLLDEADGLARRIPGSVVLRGNDSVERKADVLLDFARGNVGCLITHPKIAGAGMNFQACARTAFVGLSDSYRAYYQCIRRMWRFGQTREVRAHIVLSDAERPIYDNVLRKEGEAADLTRELVAAMRDFEVAELRGQRDMSDPYDPTTRGQWAPWVYTTHRPQGRQGQHEPEVAA